MTGTSTGLEMDMDGFRELAAAETIGFDDQEAALAEVSGRVARLSAGLSGLPGATEWLAVPFDMTFRDFADDSAARLGLSEMERPEQEPGGGGVVADAAALMPMSESAGSGMGFDPVPPGWFSSQALFPAAARVSSESPMGMAELRERAALAGGALALECIALGAAWTADMVRRGDASKGEVAAAFRERMSMLDPGVMALEEILPWGGPVAGDLSGVPLLVKSVFWAEGATASAGSRMLSRFKPPEDAAVVRAARMAGADVAAIVKTDEFAMGSTGETCAWGPTGHPFLEGRVPGGSSSGSAAALALGMGLLAYGTDTGGSVRVPASHCGLYGLKTTRGGLSRHGMVAYAMSLDTPGLMTGSLADMALFYEVAAGGAAYGQDGACRGFDRAGFSAGVVAAAGEAALSDRPAEGLVVGVPRRFLEGLPMSQGVMAGLDSIIARIGDGGARMVPVDLPDPVEGLLSYYLIACCEVQSALARMDALRLGFEAPPGAGWEACQKAARGELLGTEAKLRVMTGAAVLSRGDRGSLVSKALGARRRMAQAFAGIFESCDLMLAPSAPGPALMAGGGSGPDSWATDSLAVPASLAGICAMSLPWGSTAGGEPLGYSLHAPWHGEGVLLGGAARLEACLGLPFGGGVRMPRGGGTC